MKELVAIQKQLKAPKSQFNSFGKYNYRNCEDILESVKPLLGNCTLVLTDEVKEVAGIPYVEATAVFGNGENYTSVKAQAGISLNRKGMDISQSFGASSSYARKYALAGLFLLDDNKDADTQDNREVKEDVKDLPVDKAKDKLVKAHKDGKLKEVFFSLSTKNKEELRDFANDLRAS